MDLDLPQPQAPPLSDLAAAVNRAAEAAAAISSPSSSPSHAAAAVAVLRDAHSAIGSFLTGLDAAAAASDQPMSDGGEEEEQMVGEVEEDIREWGLQESKRRKRPVPPSWPVGRHAGGVGRAVVTPATEVAERRRAAMDLLFQFHA